MEQTKWNPGDRVQVVLETEVICELPDGLILVRMVGMPLPYSALKPIADVKTTDFHSPNKDKLE
jgi:ATP-dependent RNA circularization protein (DNA/RNA ligase family)